MDKTITNNSILTTSDSLNKFISLKSGMSQYNMQSHGIELLYSIMWENPATRY